MMRNRIFALVTVTFAALLLVGSTAAFAADDGAATFKAKCSACHGPDGAGQTTMGKSLKIRDLRSTDVQKQTDLQLMDVISGGKNKMPAYGKQLSTAQIQGLIAHVRTLKAK